MRRLADSMTSLGIMSEQAAYRLVSMFARDVTAETIIKPETGGQESRPPLLSPPSGDR